ncbi:hypothetical protein H7X65_02240 [Candidatus Parcubacteria bacterium]|nr:hypothetical protein [Candidatus Parcubacteria bacterium]
MTEIVHDAVFGNVGTMIAFRIGADDADSFEKEFKPTFLPEDFTNIGRFQMYLKLMIDGVASSAFSASAIEPWPRPDKSFVQEIVDSSRVLYSFPRTDVEAHILKWTLGADRGGKAEGAAKPKVAEQPKQPQPRIEPRREEKPRELSREPRREAPRSDTRNEVRNDRPRTERPIPVHNPFKIAFKEIEKDPEPIKEKKPEPIDVTKVPEITFDPKSAEKNGVDESILKDVLGLRE